MEIQPDLKAASSDWSWALLGEQDRTGQGADGEAHQGCVKWDSSPAGWDLIKREKREEALWRSKVKTTPFSWSSVSHCASMFSVFSHRIPATTHAVATSLPLFMNTASLDFISNLLLTEVSQPPSGLLLYPCPAPTGFSFSALWGCVFISYIAHPELELEHRLIRYGRHMVLYVIGVYPWFVGNVAGSNTSALHGSNLIRK